MFIQVVRGVVADPQTTFARLDHWLEHLAPTAHGWLGTTAGVTSDRELVSLVRFASVADARRSSDRVEQGQWWADSAAVFTGDVTFDNYEDVTVFGDGGSDCAGLVEVIVGRTRRPLRDHGLAERLAQHGSALGSSVIGGLVGVHGDGHLTQAIYFAEPGDGVPSGSLDPACLLGSTTAVAELRLLRLENLWFGSPSGAVRRGADRS